MSYYKPTINSGEKMKFEDALEGLIKMSPHEAATDAVRMYKKYIRAKGYVWIGTLFVVTLIHKIYEPTEEVEETDL